MAVTSKFNCRIFSLIFKPKDPCILWPSGIASDSEVRGRGFDPHSGRRVVSLGKINLPSKKVLVIPRKRWLRPDMTEKIVDWDVKPQPKQTNKTCIL